MQSVFARMDRDQLPIRLHGSELDGLEKFFSHLFRRMVLTVFGIGVALVSTMIYQRNGNAVVLGGGLIAALAVFAIVFVLPNPHRYPFRIRRVRRMRRRV